MPYEFKTTFWIDFSIADRFGKSAILDTYHRAFREWKDNTEYLTELVIVLNWKLWKHYENGHMTIAKTYNDLWESAQSYAYNNLTGDDLEYFVRETD